MFYRVGLRKIRNSNRNAARPQSPGRRPMGVEPLEPRTLFSESASAQLTLVSTDTTGPTPVYHYDITVTDTGTTNVGTFWFAWVPDQDFLPSIPSATTNPAGWTNTLTGSGNSIDGTAIEWVSSSNPITPGQSLGGFGFTTTDSPAALAGTSPSHPGTPVLTSFVYAGAPLADPGFQLQVSEAPTTGSAATTTTLTASQQSAALGATVSFTATVTPNASGATPTGTVNFTQNGSPLGSAPVQGDGTATLTTTSLAAGSDAVVATYSGDSTYAASSSAPLTETIIAPPSLAPTITSSTLPHAVVADTAVRGAVKLSITNETGADVKGRSTVAVYATTDGVIDGSSVLLGQVSKSLTVKAGRPSNVSVPIHLAAGVLPAGSYTLIARVTDPSGRVSDSPTAQALNAAPPFISLSEVVTKSSIPASATSGTKVRGSVQLSITNNGNISTSGATTVALFATTSGVIDDSAVQIASIVSKAHIRPGKSTRANVPLSVLPTLAPGTYTIVAQVTDQNGQTSSVTVGPMAIS